MNFLFKTNQPRIGVLPKIVRESRAPYVDSLRVAVALHPGAQAPPVGENCVGF